MTRTAIKVLTFLFAISFANLAFGQIERKTLNAKRIDNPPKIDGILKDDAWQNVNRALEVAQEFEHGKM